MARSAPAQPGQHAIVFVAITLLLDTLGFGLIVPVLPALLLQITGESVSRAAIHGGYLAFLYATMQFFCAPVLGNLSDRFGRRPVLLFRVAAYRDLSADLLVRDAGAATRAGVTSRPPPTSRNGYFHRSPLTQ